jgi:hypothetical protein
MVRAGAQGATPSAKPAARDKPWTPPKTADGQPDLQGIWTNSGEQGIPFERPDEYGTTEVLEDEAAIKKLFEQRLAAREEAAPGFGGETGAGPTHWYEFWGKMSTRTSMVVKPANGKMPPLTAEGKARLETEPKRRPLRVPGVGGLGTDYWGDRYLWERCITQGLPGMMMPGIYGSNYQIVQSKDYVVILYEMIHDARIIPLDGRPHVPSGVGLWLGDSRGRWEDNTLVVEVTNFSDKVTYLNASENLRLTERFTRVDADTLRYEVTVDDPTIWTASWAWASNLKRDPEQPRIFEYACHEGNHGLANILSAARAEDKAKAAGAGQSGKE